MKCTKCFKMGWRHDFHHFYWTFRAYYGSNGCRKAQICCIFPGHGSKCVIRTADDVRLLTANRTRRSGTFFPLALFQLPARQFSIQLNKQQNIIFEREQRQMFFFLVIRVSQTFLISDRSMTRFVHANPDIYSGKALIILSSRKYLHQ